MIWVTEDTPGDPYLIGGDTNFNAELPDIESGSTVRWPNS
jgi:hypothetical protein